jgi:hypothetical protein
MELLTSMPIGCAAISFSEHGPGSVHKNAAQFLNFDHQVDDG